MINKWSVFGIGFLLGVLWILTFACVFDLSFEDSRQTAVSTTTTTTIPSSVVEITSEASGVQRVTVDGLPCVKIGSSVTCDWSKSAN
jgi:hypothetical protein